MGDTYTSQGKKSLNISGKNVQIENLEATIVNAPLSGSSDGNFPIKAERMSIKKQHVSDVQVFVVGSAGMVFSVIGMLCHLAVALPIWPPNTTSVFSGWVVIGVQAATTVPMWAIYLAFIPFGIPCAVGRILRFHTYSIWVPFLGMLERSVNGDIYRTQLKAICPQCSGPMKMRNGKTTADYIFTCRKNVYHKHKFDMTTLPDVAEDYARRRGRQDDRPTHEDGDKTTREKHNDGVAREECSDEVENV